MSVGHSHAQLLGLRWVFGGVHTARHFPPHSSVSVGHSHLHVSGFKTSPVVESQLVTHWPWQRVFPPGHPH